MSTAHNPLIPSRGNTEPPRQMKLLVLPNLARHHEYMPQPQQYFQGLTLVVTRESFALVVSPSINTISTAPHSDLFASVVFTNLSDLNIS